MAAKAKAKVAEIYSKIPEKWRLDPADLEEARKQRNLTGLLTENFLNDHEVEIIRMDSLQLVETIKFRGFTAVEAVRAYCKTAAIAHQIVNNCLHEIMFDKALRTARELDRYLKVTKRVVSPLHGLPIGLKDQFHVKGYDTTMGYVGWIDTYEGDKDSAEVHKVNSQVVEELLSQGLFSIAKLVYPKLSWLVRRISNPRIQLATIVEHSFIDNDVRSSARQ